MLLYLFFKEEQNGWQIFGDGLSATANDSNHTSHNMLSATVSNNEIGSNKYDIYSCSMHFGILVTQPLSFGR
jgi:hypothetical protein